MPQDFSAVAERIRQRRTTPSEVALTRPEIDAIIERESAAAGVRPELIKAIVKQESDYDPKAIGPALKDRKERAVGLMQILPSTGTELGATNLYDPLQNIRAGIAYYKKNAARFGDEALAVAAHNAGPEAVEKYGGIPPYPETQGFVARVQAGSPDPGSTPGKFAELANAIRSKHQAKPAPPTPPAPAPQPAPPTEDWAGALQTALPVMVQDVMGNPAVRLGQPAVEMAQGGIQAVRGGIGAVQGAIAGEPKQTAAGLNDLIEGVMSLGSPIILTAQVLAPWTTPVTLGAAMLAQKEAAALAKRQGWDDEYARLAGNSAALVAAGIGGRKILETYKSGSDAVANMAGKLGESIGKFYRGKAQTAPRGLPEGTIEGQVVASTPADEAVTRGYPARVAPAGRPVAPAAPPLAQPEAIQPVAPPPEVAAPTPSWPPVATDHALPPEPGAEIAVPPERIVAPVEAPPAVAPEAPRLFSDAYFRSGLGTPTDLMGFVEADVPIGVTATGMSKRVQALAKSYADKGGRVFVDSGAFGNDAIDFPSVFLTYDALAKNSPENLWVVAPDKVGDAQATTALQRQYQEQINALLRRGVHVIFPVQKGAELSKQIALVTQTFGKGPTVVVGIPSNRSAFTPEEVVTALSALPDTAKPQAIHLLGIGDENAKIQNALGAIRAALPDLTITSDSNRLPAIAGKGRAIERGREQAIQDVAIERSDDTEVSLNELDEAEYTYLKGLVAGNDKAEAAALDFVHGTPKREPLEDYLENRFGPQAVMEWRKAIANEREKPTVTQQESRRKAIANIEILGANRPAPAPSEPVAEAPAPAPEIPGAAKEPWQMTANEWLASSRFYRSGKQKMVELPDGERVILHPKDTAETFQAKDGFIAGIHKGRVRYAVEQGKPVPPAVLADYPDLQARVPGAAAIQMRKTLAQRKTEKQAEFEAIKRRQAALEPLGVFEEGEAVSWAHAKGYPQFVPGSVVVRKGPETSLVRIAPMRGVPSAEREMPNAILRRMEPAAPILAPENKPTLEMSPREWDELSPEDRANRLKLLSPAMRSWFYKMLNAKGLGEEPPPMPEEPGRATRPALTGEDLRVDRATRRRIEETAAQFAAKSEVPPPPDLPEAVEPEGGDVSFDPADLEPPAAEPEPSPSPASVERDLGAMAQPESGPSPEEAPAPSSSGVERETTYFKGEPVAYTGQVRQIHGGTFYEVVFLEGRKKGLKAVIKYPPTGARPNLSQPALPEDMARGAELLQQQPTFEAPFTLNPEIDRTPKERETSLFAATPASSEPQPTLPGAETVREQEIATPMLGTVEQQLKAGEPLWKFKRHEVTDAGFNEAHPQYDEWGRRFSNLWKLYQTELAKHPKVWGGAAGKRARESAQKLGSYIYRVESAEADGRKPPKIEQYKGDIQASFEAWIKSGAVASAPPGVMRDIRNWLTALRREADLLDQGIREHDWYESGHQRAVRDAVREGKPVPSDVLSPQYPGFQRTVSSEAEAGRQAFNEKKRSPK